MKNIFFTFTLCFVLWSCETAPHPIFFGEDQCHFCKMTIVDQQHAAELVTKKGKAYKYDAIECMLQDKANNQPTNVALYLTMDYDSPKTFIDATQATFLISKKVPSPMGAYLSAFEKYENAKQLQEEKSGQLYNWEEIKQKFEEE